MKSTLLISVYLFLCLATFPAFSADIATCENSSGYAYGAFRRIYEEKNTGWIMDSESYPFTLTQNKYGDFDLLFLGPLGVSSSVSDGATIIPASISNEAVTVVVLYPGKVVETYIFQKLKNGKYQAMWTRAKAETPLPGISAYVADCSYLDLSAIQK